MLSLGSLNIFSVNNKVDAVRQLIIDRRLDVLTLCETWHEDSDAVCIRRLRADGYTVLECARIINKMTDRNRIGFTNHGGVAIIARRGVRLAKLQPTVLFTKFEYICSRVSVTGDSYVIAAIYRPSTKDVCATFHKGFRLLLGYLSSFQTPVLITGDFNIHIERPNDSDTIWLQNTLSSFGLVQRVDRQPTHKKGGTIDVIITRTDDVISAVDTHETGMFDHKLLQTEINLKQPAACYTSVQSRCWRQLNLDKFRTDLFQSLNTEPMNVSQSTAFSTTPYSTNTLQSGRSPVANEFQT